MDTWILVVTTARSGSSAVAGALHRLGVFMGPDKHLIGPSPQFNPKGHFEDRRWHDLLKKYSAVPEQLPQDQIATLVANRRAEHVAEGVLVPTPAIFGLKSPYLAPYFPNALSWFKGNVRIVAVHRNFGATVRSHQRHGNGGNGMSQSAAEQRQVDRCAQLYRGLASVQGRTPTIHVTYEQILDHAAIAIKALSSFVFDGLSIQPAPEKLDDAIASIDPSLRHYVT